MNDSNRFALNVGSNGIRILLAGITWMVLTPFLVSKIGMDAYGVVGLSFSFFKMMTFFGTAFRTPFVRFFSLALQRGNKLGTDRYFNTGLFSTIGLLIMGLAVSPIIIFFSHHILRFPTGLEIESGVVLAAGLIAALLLLMQSVFEAVPFAQNRLDLVNLALSSRNLILLIGIISTFILFRPVLWQVGLWFVISGIGSLAVAWWLWCTCKDDLSINLKLFGFSDLKDILPMSGWISLNQAGGVLLTQVNVFIVNAFLGPEVQGRFSAVRQWELLVQMLAMSLSLAIVPTLLKKFATTGKRELAVLSVQAVKLLGIALSVPVGLIVGFSGPLLTIWLGSEYQFLWPLMVVMVGHMCITMGYHPLLSVQMTLNEVRLPAFVTLVSAAISILMAFWWVHWKPELGLGVALAAVLGLTGKHVLFTPLYTSKLLETSKMSYYRAITPGIVGTILVAGGSYLVSSFYRPLGWISLALFASIVIALYGGLVFWLFFDLTDRDLIKGFLFFKKAAV